MCLWVRRRHSVLYDEQQLANWTSPGNAGAASCAFRRSKPTHCAELRIARDLRAATRCPHAAGPIAAPFQRVIRSLSVLTTGQLACCLEQSCYAKPTLVAWSFRAPTIPISLRTLIS